METLEKQLKKKNEEFTEAQKTYKEQVESQSKTFADQLKIRNEEFHKLQTTSSRQLEELQKNFQEQQKQRAVELDHFKKEIALLHEKNVQSAVNEKTATLQVHLETLQQDNTRLKEKAKKGNTNYAALVISVIIALILGFIIAKIL